MRLLPLVASSLIWAPRAGAGALQTRPPPRPALPRRAASADPAGRPDRKAKDFEDLSESVDALERAVGAAKKQAHDQRRVSLAHLRAPHGNRSFPDHAEREALEFLKEDLEGNDLLSRARDLAARARHAVKLVQRIDGLEAELARATRALEERPLGLREEQAREVQELRAEVSAWHGVLARFRASGPGAGGAAPRGGSAAARGVAGQWGTPGIDDLIRADEEEDRKEVVIDGYPQFPGCYFRLNSGCKNHFKKTHLWRHDVWAEAGNLTQSQCALRRHYWNTYCGITDAKTVYIAQPSEVEESDSQPDLEEKASWTIDGYPRHHGCFMRLPSGCPNHFKKSHLWRHDVSAEEANATRSECLARKRYWNEYCGVADAKVVHIGVPDGAAAGLAAAPRAGRPRHGRLTTLRRTPLSLRSAAPRAHHTTGGRAGGRAA